MTIHNNQRVIKFRAWDKKQKQMWSKKNFGVMSFRNNFHTIDFDGEVWDFMNGERVKNEDFILMQFTGLLDKNGKEIYEGDIVRENNNLGISELHYKIGYKDGHTSMTGCNKGNEYDKHGIWNLISSLEIIGNIYSNPELL